jgi:hypothetical protein
MILVIMKALSKEGSSIRRQQYPKQWLLEHERELPAHIILIDPEFNQKDSVTPQIFDDPEWVLMDKVHNRLCCIYENTVTGDVVSALACPLPNDEIFFFDERDQWKKQERVPESVLGVSFKEMGGHNRLRSCIVGNFYDKSALPVFDSRLDAGSSTSFVDTAERHEQYIQMGVLSEQEIELSRDISSSPFIPK